MSKNLYRLLAKFKHLGCKVIHGSFQKVILSVGKRSYEEAESYINYVLGQVKKDPLFRELELEAGEYWRILLFKDTFDHAGITESNPNKLCSEMNIVRHLPEEIKKKFTFTVMEFCTKTLKYNKSLFKDQVLRPVEENQ